VTAKQHEEYGCSGPTVVYAPRKLSNRETCGNITIGDYNDGSGRATCESNGDLLIGIPYVILDAACSPGHCSGDSGVSERTVPIPNMTSQRLTQTRRFWMA
jgi:hypothetical protein